MFKQVIRTFGSKLISLFLVFFTGVIISRTFGTEGKGAMTLLLLVPTLITVYLGFSIGEGILFYLGKKNISKKTFNNTLLKLGIYFIPFFIIVYVMMYCFIKQYEYSIYPQLILLGLLFYNVILKYAIRGVLYFKVFNIVQILESLIVFSGLLVVVYFKLHIESLLWAYVLSYFTLNIYLYIATTNRISKSVLDVSLRTIFKYSYKVHFFKILNFTESKFDILLIGYFLSVGDVGIYSIAVSITLIFQTIVQSSISSVLFPSLVNSNSENRIYQTIRYFKFSMFLAFVFLICFFASGKWFIISFYGVDFSSAYIPMIILLIGALAKSPAACLNSYFKASGRPQELYKTSIYTVTINIVLCFILIPKHGIIGAAIASTISYFMYGAIMLFKFKKTSNFTISNLMITKKDFKALTIYISNKNIK